MQNTSRQHILKKQLRFLVIKIKGHVLSFYVNLVRAVDNKKTKQDFSHCEHISGPKYMDPDEAKMKITKYDHKFWQGNLTSSAHLFVITKNILACCVA